jgi:nitroimidazol reductase NimA-like FMN-containing flavoprotein (pyridoxamine 5'-phosphate oxidase superfamily)
MNSQIAAKVYVEATLQAQRFAVLATERGGQPHTSFVAITPIGDFRQLIFATYRRTRKYRNLAQNGKVAVLIDGQEVNSSGLKEGFVLTALGHAEEVCVAEDEVARRAHLAWHPDLASFVQSADCALVRVTVREYQVVGAIDDVRWWRIDDLAGA